MSDLYIAVLKGVKYGISEYVPLKVLKYNFSNVGCIFKLVKDVTDKYKDKYKVFHILVTKEEFNQYNKIYEFYNAKKFWTPLYMNDKLMFIERFYEREYLIKVSGKGRERCLTEYNQIEISLIENTEEEEIGIFLEPTYCIFKYLSVGTCNKIKHYIKKHDTLWVYMKIKELKKFNNVKEFLLYVIDKQKSICIETSKKWYTFPETIKNVNEFFESLREVAENVKF